MEKFPIGFDASGIDAQRAVVQESHDAELLPALRKKVVEDVQLAIKNGMTRVDVDLDKLSVVGKKALVGELLEKFPGRIIYHWISTWQDVDTWVRAEVGTAYADIVILLDATESGRYMTSGEYCRLRNGK